MTEGQDIGAMLHGEHLHTLAIANALETRIFGTNRDRPLDPANPDDARFVDELIGSIDTDIHRHFRFEEEVLFPRVSEAGLHEVTTMLVEEHAMIRTMADELATLARSAGAGGLDVRQWARFRDTAMDFIHAAMFHIQKEEMGVVRALSLTLGAAASREMAAEYAAFQAANPAAP